MSLSFSLSLSDQLVKVVDAEVGLGAKLHTMILTHRQVDSGIRLFLFLSLALSS